MQVQTELILSPLCAGSERRRKSIEKAEDWARRNPRPDPRQLIEQPVPEDAVWQPGMDNKGAQTSTFEREASGLGEADDEDLWKYPHRLNFEDGDPHVARPELNRPVVTSRFRK